MWLDTEMQLKKWGKGLAVCSFLCTFAAESEKASPTRAAYCLLSTSTIKSNVTMLNHLYIRNFTLIDQLDMAFHSGFSVITGETGAGKSIILGAIGLLLGQRADVKTIKQGADKCVVEAHFDLSNYDEMDRFFADNAIEADLADTIVRRELTAVGKSRAFINDSPVPIGVLKELGERLIDVHSQHQNLLLGRQDFQMEVTDIIAADQQELTAYHEAFDAYCKAAKELADLREQTERDRQNEDFMRFQYDELTALRLADGEQKALEARSETMTHAEDIKRGLYEADCALQAEGTNIVGLARRATQALRGIERVFPPVAELADRLDAAYIELKDVAAEVNAKLDDVDFDPAELDAVNDRLDRLYAAQKKYRVDTVAGLMAIRDELAGKLAVIEGGDGFLADKEAEAERLLAGCRTKAQALTAKRQEAALLIEREMRQRLTGLGMPNGRFEVAVEGNELTRTGYDRIHFLFSANASTPLQPVSQVASGGEIARVMLALKAMISGAMKLPTIIFDEIDTGVSGRTAVQMAHIMAEMGQGGRQVISITHLPQIAAMGTTHYKVYKEETPQGTTSHLVMLSSEERVDEIAQMLSGSNVTDVARENARQLLKIEK